MRLKNFVKVIRQKNLTMLDLGMARIIAECMDEYYSGQGSEVSVATQKVAQDDPLHINSPEGQPMYAYKINVVHKRKAHHSDNLRECASSFDAS